MKPMLPNPTSGSKQRGAAFIVMLVIMIMGVTFFLVSSLSSSSLRIAREKKTSGVLAQAKEALIARSVVDSTQPGGLPCPNIANGANDGIANPGPDCPSYIGRLPWRTLGLPDLRDASGAPLWYALSRNFRKDPGASHINSDTPGTLTVTGNSSAGNVVAIVFAPGTNLTGQSRSNIQIGTCGAAENLCASNYLEGVNATASPAALPNTQYIAGDASDAFNDQMIYITQDNLLPNVEKRIAREIKQCLDDYSAISAQKYPWAAPVASLGYTSTATTLFGRIPDQPRIEIPTTIPIGDSTDTNIVALLNALDNLQTAVNNCKFNDNLQSALTSAGNAVQTAVTNITNPPFSSSFITAVTAAGVAAHTNVTSHTACKYIDEHPTSNPVQTNLNTANSTLPSTITINVPEDTSMQANWPAACILFAPPAYWADWKEMVFYSVSDAYRPNGTKSCPCLSVSGNGNPNPGTGNYRAAVIVAGKNLTQLPRNPGSVASYLEGLNSAVPSTTTLETWQLTEQKAKNINDFVVCVDGKGSDQNSKCY